MQTVTTLPKAADSAESLGVPVATGCGQLRWYVVNTHPAQEYLAWRCLVKQSYEAWLPECVMRRITRKTVMAHKGPLFPTYLFVRLDLGVC